MLQNAKNNPDVGLANALRVMVKAWPLEACLAARDLQVCEECRRHEAASQRLIIQFSDLAGWAKDRPKDLKLRAKSFHILRASTTETLAYQDYHGDHPRDVALRSRAEVQGDAKAEKQRLCGMTVR